MTVWLGASCEGGFVKASKAAGSVTIDVSLSARRLRRCSGVLRLGRGEVKVVIMIADFGHAIKVFWKL